MSDTDSPDATVIQFPAPAEMQWTTPEAGEAFVAEHARRTEAGESLAGLQIPVVMRRPTSADD